MDSGLLSQLTALDSALATKFSEIETYCHANKQSGQLNADYTTALNAGLQACIDWYTDTKMPYLANAYIQTLAGYLQVRETFPDATPALINADHTPYALLDQGNFIGTIKTAALSYWIDGVGITGGTKLTTHFTNFSTQTALAQGYLNRYVNKMHSKTAALLTWQSFEDLTVNDEYANANIRTMIFTTLGWDAFLRARGLHALGIYSYPRDNDFEVATLEPLPVVDPDDPEYDPANFLQYILSGDVPFFVRDGHFKLLFQPGADNTLTWEAGSVTFMSDTNQYVSAAINAGSATHTGSRIFIAYVPGNSTLVVTTNPATAYINGQSIVAIYDGGYDLRVFNTTRVILGTEVAVTSMPPNRLDDGDLLKKVRIGDTGSLYLDGSADKIIMGSPTAPTAVFGAHSETGFTTTGGYRMRTEDGELLLDSVNGLAPNTVGSLNIRPGSVQEYHLYFGARSIQEEGITVTLDSPNDRVQWSSGNIVWFDDLGNTISTPIISGQAFYEGERIFIVWEKGSDRFTVTTSTAIAYDSDNYYIFAEYNGGDQLFRNFQSTLIDGDRIKTGTMELNRLKADSILSQTFFVGSDKFVLDGANKYMRIKDDVDVTRLLLGEISSGVFGVKIFDANGDPYIDTTGADPFFARDDEITNALKFIGGFATEPATTYPVNSVYYNTVNGNQYVLEYISGTDGPKQWNVFSLAGADGMDGSDGIDARSVSLTLDNAYVSYNTNGGSPSSSLVTATATALNTSGTVFYEFFINDVSVQNTASNSYEYTVPSTIPASSVKFEVQIREGSALNPVLARDQSTLPVLRNSQNAINISLSNEAHTLPRTNAGVVTYTNSGTDINVWEGTAQLPYDAALSVNSSWRVSDATGTNITVGSASTVSDTRRFDDHNSMTATPALVTYTIEVKNFEGTVTTFTRVQSLSFSQQGATGNDGLDGNDGSNGLRGSVHLYGTATSWSDATANSTITGAGYAYKVIGDRVTLSSNSNGFSQTKVWDGSAWQTLTEVLDGSLLVTGSLIGSKVAANTIETRSLKISGSSGGSLNFSPDFSDSTAWNQGSGTVTYLSDTSSPAGSNIARLSGASQLVSISARKFSIVPGKTYKVTAIVRKASGSTGNYYMRCYRLNGSGTQVGYTLLKATTGTENHENKTYPADDTWYTYNGFFTAEGTAVQGYLSFHGNWAGSGTTDVAYFDIKEQIEGNLLVDGSVSAQQLSANFGTFESYLRVGEAGNDVDATFIAGNAYDTTYRIWSGDLLPMSAPFSVDKNGKVIAQNLEIYNAGELVFSSSSGFTDFGRNLVLLNSATLVNPLVETLDDNTDFIPITLLESTDVKYEIRIPSRARGGMWGGGYAPTGGIPSDPWPSSITVNIQRALAGGGYSTILTKTLTKGVHYEVTLTYTDHVYLETDDFGDLYAPGTYSYTMKGKGVYLGESGATRYPNPANSTEVTGWTHTTSTADSYEFRVNITESSGSYIQTRSRTISMTDIDPGTGFIRADTGSTGGAVTNADTLNSQPGSYYTNASNLSSGTVPTARLGSGTADSTTYLRGDNTWQTISAGGGGDVYLANTQTFTGINTFGGFTSTANSTRIVLRPSDYGTGKPQLGIKKTSSANQWSVELWDGTNSNGTINFAAQYLTHNGGTIWTTNNDGSGSGLDADTVDGIQGSSIFRTDTANSANVNLASGNGRGIKFWNSDSYSIWMSIATDATYGGRVSGETTSDYNMYFRMSHGTNRGFVFQNNTTAVAGIDAVGAFRSNRVICGYEHGASNSIGCSNWFRSSGDSGWFNGTHGGGIYMTDTTWVRLYNGKALYVPNQIAATGSITASYSDERLKIRVGTIDSALDKVLSLDGFIYVENDLAKSFGYNNEKHQVGLSAQQVKAVLPEAVSLAPFDMHTEDDGTITSASGEEYLTLDYAKLVPLLIEAIKDVDSLLQAKDRRIEKLERDVEDLKALVRKLIGDTE